ncbi:MAG: hypothetical protein Q7R56_02380 [Nanoarchaeota archaeon]|nr:hypothetical protein [Nanoarchaeota archaeon]
MIVDGIYHITKFFTNGLSGFYTGVGLVVLGILLLLKLNEKNKTVFVSLRKKGDTHIDWAISMGLFIVAIMMIVIFIKPGIQPLHQEENLLNILEKQFLQTSTWTIHQLPLYIEQQEKRNGNQQPIITLTIPEWAFSNCEQKTTSTQQGTISTTCGTTATIQCTSDTPSTCKNHIIHVTYYPTQPEPAEPEFQTPLCTNTNNDNLDEDINCQYTLGATEELKGISNDKLTNLSQANYATIKQQWHYPEEKHFAIYKITPSGEEKINGGDPFGAKNTYVREIKYWTINKEGERTPLTISIRSW